VILVDTSVWIGHLRASNLALVRLLGESGVLIHPFIVGELALGNLRNRAGFLEALRRMPESTRATDDEVVGFIDANRLYGLGLGYADAHLLVSARLTAGARLWTRDQRLANVAERFDLRAEPLV
jgi:predicted nucleic acid-binding protein